MVYTMYVQCALCSVHMFVCKLGYGFRHMLMINGDKKVVSKQPFASFPKLNSLQF